MEYKQLIAFEFFFQNIEALYFDKQADRRRTSNLLSFDALPKPINDILMSPTNNAGLALASVERTNFIINQNHMWLRKSG